MAVDALLLSHSKACSYASIFACDLQLLGVCMCDPERIIQFLLLTDMLCIIPTALSPHLPHAAFISCGPCSLVALAHAVFGTLGSSFHCLLQPQCCRQGSAAMKHTSRCRMLLPVQRTSHCSLLVSVQYYDDTAGILRSVILSAIAPHRMAASPMPQAAFTRQESATGPTVLPMTSPMEEPLFSAFEHEAQDL